MRIKNSFSFFCLFVCLHQITLAQSKPNILWITIEDTSPKFIGCYGNKDARTPAIDRLAADGIRFTNAFSTGTVCSPSRTALITGLKTYESGTGNHRSNYPVPAFMHGFPYYLQQAGYHTSNNAKTDYNVNDEKAFIADAWNESSGKAGWWNRKPGQPFFAVFNFNDSHQSRTMTDAYPKYVSEVFDQLPEADRIAENGFAMPPIYRDTPEMRMQFARVYNALKLTDNKIEKLLQRLDGDHLRDSTIIFFFGDHGEGIPRGKTNGIDLGYRVPFIIWFPPMYKHLSPWGKAGAVTDELIDFTDLAPTLIGLAGGEIPYHMKGRKLIGPSRSRKKDHLVLSSERSDNGIDMVRTVTDGRFLYSRNYMPFMPEARYIRYMEISEIKQQMRNDFKDKKLNELQASLFAERPAEFLFDTKNDPWETKNLIDDPKHKSVAAKLRAQLRTELLKARDVMFLPEYEIAQISKKEVPFQYRLSGQNYPISKILAAAELAGQRGSVVLQKQIRLLKDPDKIVRYWAVLGLRSQPPALLKNFEKEIANAGNDPYPPVAITGSAIGFDVFNSTSARKKLKAFSLTENNELALMAINDLLYMTDKKPFIDTIKTKQQALKNASTGDKSQVYKVRAACMDFLGSLGLVPNTPDFAE